MAAPPGRGSRGDLRRAAVMMMLVAHDASGLAQTLSVIPRATPRDRPPRGALEGRERGRDVVVA